ncbi:MAG: hypothetical protein DHS20C15_30360 [Planctomycetota bacterium]|nr:MAG: hypothetical protein DHS20C15_30360 [Planctomycetota bacterium]
MLLPLLLGAADLRARRSRLPEPLLPLLERAEIVAIVRVNEPDLDAGADSSKRSGWSQRWNVGCQAVAQIVKGATLGECLDVSYQMPCSLGGHFPIQPEPGLNLVISVSGIDHDITPKRVGTRPHPVFPDDAEDVKRVLRQALELLPARGADRPVSERVVAETAWFARAARVPSLRDLCTNEILNLTRDVESAVALDFDDSTLQASLGVLLDLHTLEDAAADDLAIALNAQGVDAASDWVAWEFAQFLLDKRPEVAPATLETAMWALVRPAAPRAERIELSAHLRHAKQTLEQEGRTSEAFLDALRRVLASSAELR